MPSLPMAALFSLGLHLIALLFLLNWLLQVGHKNQPKPPSRMQVSLQEQKIESEPGLHYEVAQHSIAKELADQNEPKLLAQIESETIQGALIETGLASETIYWPRSKLSAVPQLETPIALLYPEGFEPQQAHYETILSVYINEYGQVDQVELEDDDFPAALAQAAIRAFQSARYQAGARDNQAVKARIRIAISFDAFTAPTIPSDAQGLNE